MKKVIVDISKKGNMLNKLVDSLDGALPYMTNSEQKDYDDYGKVIKKDYNNFITKNKEYVPNENQEIIKGVVDEYEETSTCRNALLNDLYYKDGVRDGICLLFD